MKNQPWYGSAPSEAEVSQELEFNLWKARQPPFNDLEAGDHVWLVNPTGPGEAIVSWEVNVRKVVTAPYASKVEAWKLLRLGFPGQDLTRAHFMNLAYTKQAADQGWLLAWDYEPVRKVMVSRPQEIKLLKNGWLNLDRFSEPQLKKWGLTAGSARGEVPKATPVRPAPGARGVDAQRNRAVELRAMDVARRYLTATLGWSKQEIFDTSSDRPYDFECRGSRDSLRVEVKGLSGSLESVVLTRREVENARAASVRTILLVVSGIRVETSAGGELRGVGGDLVAWDPWNVDDGQLVPASFDYRPPTP